MKNSLAEALSSCGVQEGTPALHLVLSLPQIIGSIRALTFTTYPPSPGFEERSLNSTDPVLRRASEKARELGELSDEIPYWEAILASALLTRGLDSALKEALSHDKAREVSQRFVVEVSELTGQYLERLTESLPEGNVLALCSNCTREDGSTGHIPMMDFRCPPSIYNSGRLKKVITRLGLKGAILESGRSYHFYGFEILTQDEWVQYLGKCLLIGPLTDTRYIAHRLIGGACVLRVTATELKPMAPTVKEIIL